MIVRSVVWERTLSIEDDTHYKEEEEELDELELKSSI